MHPEVRELLDQLVPAVVAAVDPIGVVLWGSVVLGGYVPGDSDVDLLVLLRDEPDDTLRDAVQPLHDAVARRAPAWTHRVEVAYVGLDGLRSFRDQAHAMVRISPGEPLNLRSADRDWSIDWFQARHHGVALVGLDLAGLLPDVTADELRQTAARLLRGAGPPRVGPADGYRAYELLLRCRALVATTEARQVSKQEAGRIVGRLHPRWRDVLDRAVVVRDGGDAPIAPDEVVAFSRWALQQLP